MSKHNDYMNLEYDLAGSRSKNRFKNELLWGLSKIFDLYKNNINFSVIFDYVCDIEVHFDDSYEFYQIKTSKGSSAYTLSKILKPTNGSSVLGKLFDLKHQSIKNGLDSKIALVCNKALKDFCNKEHSDREILEFNSLKTSCKDKIINILSTELGEFFDLDNSYFIYSEMNLNNCEDEFLGKTVRFYSEVTNSELANPLKLYNLLKSEIEIKSSYELACNDYDSLILKKALTKRDLDKILDLYYNGPTLTEKVTEFINSEVESFRKRLAWKKAFSKLYREFSVSSFLEALDKKVREYIVINIDDFDCSRFELIDKLYPIFKGDFGPEFEESDIRVFLLFVIIKLEEGSHEQFIS
ncbi:hypothetical protein EUAN_09150 [Andreesenia angusta]|uniref:CD-NTase associated protein 4-like DNA endonuclease domain-containing protein n=1 Tax=Andreesenia angusta TaxID=39480 RepID=A0A1S1V935_9FIRM|nr:dsDNA nuclease domain-containing protein [Andreesenia angusta]OHW63131.1 hypothetical protein EUAN_09150 [Andreesenia angusta]